MTTKIKSILLEKDSLEVSTKKPTEELTMEKITFVATIVKFVFNLIKVLGVHVPSDISLIINYICDNANQIYTIILGYYLYLRSRQH